MKLRRVPYFLLFIVKQQEGEAMATKYLSGGNRMIIMCLVCLVIGFLGSFFIIKHEKPSAVSTKTVAVLETEKASEPRVVSHQEKGRDTKEVATIEVSLNPVSK